MINTRIISIINQKGGCGKTSLATLICRTLAQRGYNILAIDCDPQGGLSNFLCGTVDKGLITQALMGEVVYPFSSLFADIDIYTADYKLDKLYVTTDHFAIKRILKMVEGLQQTYEYDYVVIDTPPTMQGITRAAIHISDQIFIPCEISKSTLGPTLYTLECLEEMEKRGKVVFIDSAKENTGHMAEIEKMFMDEIKDNYAGTIRRDLTTQKIVSGDCDLTPLKIEKYLEPIWRLIDGTD